MRDLDPFGRSDLLDFAPHISWNESMSIASLTLDVSGAGTYMTSVETETGSWRLRLDNENSGFSWSGVARWLDDRFLFCPITLTSAYDSGNERAVDTTRLTVFDVETGALKVVYESAKMFDAVASEHYVAIFEAVGDSYRIIVSAWEKDPDGRIIGPEYIANDVPRDKSDGSPDWDRFGIPPLKFVTGKQN
jgi:hypothetical protein